MEAALEVRIDQGGPSRREIPMDGCNRCGRRFGALGVSGLVG